jgi:hypothetical protein
MEEINWKNCECCEINFLKRRDYEKHIKTNKHLKKSTGISINNCPYCLYTSDSSSNIKKHIKSVHREEKQDAEEKVIKVGNTNIPDKILNQYFTLKDGVSKAQCIMLGKKYRIKNLKNRLYKDDEKEVIEAKKEYKMSIDFYNNNLKALKSLEEKFPEIIKAIQPKINDDGDAEEDSEEEDEIEKAVKEQKNNKILDLEDLKDELEELYDQLRNREFKDLKAHKMKIDKLEKEVKKMMIEIYK